MTDFYGVSGRTATPENDPMTKAEYERKIALSRPPRGPSTTWLFGCRPTTPPTVVWPSQPRNSPGTEVPGLDDFSPGDLDGTHVACLQAFRALRYLECHVLIFFERLVAITRDRGEMNENVRLTVVLANETEALLRVEPLHGTGCHFYCILFIFTRLFPCQLSGRPTEQLLLGA
jgi:hypothetical protein